MSPGDFYKRTFAQIITSRQEKMEMEREEIWRWGAGTDGQLGTAELEDEHLPRLLHLPSLLSASPISMLACGGAHVLALTSGGRVFSWGRGTSGQLGHGDMVSCFHPKPVDFLESHFITHVSAGWSHSGFVSDKGYVFTCGDGSFGQLGHGDFTSLATPVKVSFFDNKCVEQIACGMRHSLVMLKDCSVYAFGSGKRGQLGISNEKIKSISLPQVTSGFENVEVVSISANGDHSAALSGDGHVYTWGRGFSGAADVYFPKCLTSSLQFSRVAVGWNHILLLTEDGEVFMLGGSHHGVLSDLEKMSHAKHSSDSGEATLHRVTYLERMKVLQVAAGAEHSALVTADGAIKSWGWGEHGQLGLGDTSDQTSPQTVRLGKEEIQENEALVRVYCGSGFTFAIRSFTTIKSHQITT